MAFFQGIAKFSGGLGAKTYYLPLKNTKKDTIILKKVKNILYVS